MRSTCATAFLGLLLDAANRGDIDEVRKNLTMAKFFADRYGEEWLLKELARLEEQLLSPESR